MLGTEGIAVGMSTKIMPHNLGELQQAKSLRNEPWNYSLTLSMAALWMPANTTTVAGKVRVRARIDARGDKNIVITEIPYGTTTESVIASIEAAAQKGKVKIGGINDYTTENVEIELSLPRGVYAQEVIPQLYAWTDCEVSISSNVCVIQDRHPVVQSVTRHFASMHLAITRSNPCRTAIGIRGPHRQAALADPRTNFHRKPHL